MTAYFFLNFQDSKQNAIMKARIGKLYLLLGRELEELSEVKSGNIVGIGGLENYILKSATISSNIACTPFVEITQSAAPILRVAVEPDLSSDLNALVSGLHLLNQADANVQVFLNDKGEHILMTAGEVHLERCIRDLKETYAGIEVVVSSPIVPFRETIIDPPKIDMVNEEIVHTTNEESDKEKIVTLTTPNKQCTVTLMAFPLPKPALSVIETHQDLLKADTSGANLTPESIEAKEDFKNQLEKILNQSPHEPLHDIRDRILSFGPKHIGNNILVKSSHCSSLGDKYLSSLIHGFQLATLSGPLCEEPLSGCCFVCMDFSVDETIESDDLYGPLSGQIVSIVKEGCRRAFQAHPQRLEFHVQIF